MLFCIVLLATTIQSTAPFILIYKTICKAYGRWEDPREENLRSCVSQSYSESSDMCNKTKDEFCTQVQDNALRYESLSITIHQ